MLHDFWIFIFKLIKSLIVLVTFEAVICIISIQKYYCVEVLQINCLT